MIATLVALAFNTGPATAESDNAQNTPRVGDPYPLKVDPLGASLVDVEEPIVVIHEGRELQFTDEANVAKFNIAPDKYLTQVDALIIAQQKQNYPLKSCPVSGQELGKMGGPVDLVYGNRLVRLCCGGCEGALKKETARHFEKIDAAVIEQQQADYPLETCVISGEKLGMMGEPADYVIGTQLVRFCCPGCMSKFEKAPARYLQVIETKDTAVE